MTLRPTSLFISECTTNLQLNNMLERGKFRREMASLAPYCKSTYILKSMGSIFVFHSHELKKLSTLLLRGRLSQHVLSSC